MGWLLWDSVMTGCRWLLGGRKAPQYGFSYARNASAKILIYGLPFFLVPDQVVWMLFVPAQYWYLRPLFLCFDLYAMLVLAGIIASFDTLPHTIDGDVVTLHQGILRTAMFRRSDVAQTAVFGTEIDKSTIWAKGGKSAAYLLTMGAPTVKLVLRTPTAVESLGGRKKSAEVLFVSVDDPAFFLATLKAAA